VNNRDGIMFDVPKPWLYRTFAVPESDARQAELRHFLKRLHDEGSFELGRLTHEHAIEAAGIPPWTPERSTPQGVREPPVREPIGVALTARVSIERRKEFPMAHPIRFGIQTGQQLVAWKDMLAMWRKADHGGLRLAVETSITSTRSSSTPRGPASKHGRR
jgi:hypothetical protein